VGMRFNQLKRREFLTLLAEPMGAAVPRAPMTRPRTNASHAAFRPGQLGPVKAKFLTDAAYNARVKDLARSAERDFRLPPLVMDYHHDWPLASRVLT